MPRSRLDRVNRIWSDDDASGYADLPADWPHDQYCLACADLRAATGPMSKRDRNGKSYTDWDSRGEEASEAAHFYPNRFRALLEHRRLIHQSKRAADARHDDTQAES